MELKRARATLTIRKQLVRGSGRNFKVVADLRSSQDALTTASRTMHLVLTTDHQTFRAGGIT